MSEVKHTVLLFGQLIDIVGDKEILVANAADTDALRNCIVQMYPDFEKLKFAIAVDNQIINEFTLLKEDCTIALLPPFSGG